MFKKPVDVRFMKNLIIIGIYINILLCRVDSFFILAESVPEICNLASNKANENDYNQPIS